MRALRGASIHSPVLGVRWQVGSDPRSMRRRPASVPRLYPLGQVSGVATLEVNVAPSVVTSLMRPPTRTGTGASEP